MKTIDAIRYRLALRLVSFAINWVLPDEYTRSRMQMGMIYTSQLIKKEIAGANNDGA